MILFFKFNLLLIKSKAFYFVTCFISIHLKSLYSAKYSIFSPFFFFPLDEKVWFILLKQGKGKY